MAKTRRGILYTSAAVLSTSFLLLWVGLKPLAPINAAKADESVSVAPVTPVVEMTPIELPQEATLAADNAPNAINTINAAPATVTPLQLAQRDPQAFIDLAAERCRKQVDDYQCLMTKKELVNGKYTNQQEIELRFRDEPRAIFMIWRKNADGCKRALFQDQPEYVDESGQKLARVEPNGLARLLVADIMLPVDGPEAKKASRHSIDHAGFQSFFSLLGDYTKTASQDGVLDLRCAGTSKVDNRPTIVIERRLPYTGENGAYPDALLVMHFDSDTLLPVAVYSYADGEGKRLLGSYVYTNIVLRPSFNDTSFKF